ncbi:MAG TPA: heavy metal-binding domain-containing protein [Vicinamibacterales bacterium]|nr:heavy metal-binding domain-containing protein [Vicinamibacterales bacterium]
MPTKFLTLRAVVTAGLLTVGAVVAGQFYDTAQAVAASPQAAAQASAQKPADLPPLVYLCPMPQDADVVEDKPGKCPKCGMELKPVRIVAAYSCLKNSAFIQEQPGKCPTDRTDMVPVSVSLFFGCKGNNDVHELFPGKCPDGSDRIKKYEPRPHGDHNPRHGGLLFMADDSWHHLEGAYPSAGLFRVYFYDDWTKPMAPAGFSARAVVKDNTGKELGTYPLKPGKISNALEVQVPNAGLPFTSTVFVTFKPGDRERRFDFQFMTYTKEPAASPAPAKSGAELSLPSRSSRKPVLLAAANTGAPVLPTAWRHEASARDGIATVQRVAYEPAAAAFQDPPRPPGVQMESQVELMAPIVPQEDPIPASAKDVMKELDAKTQEVEQLIRDGSLPMVWVPAMRSKNLALALLDDHLKEIPEKDRPLATSAVNRLLRAAWQIDTLGDLGDKDKILTVHSEFSEAAKDLTSAYASLR